MIYGLHRSELWSGWHLTRVSSRLYDGLRLHFCTALHDARNMPLLLIYRFLQAIQKSVTFDCSAALWQFTPNNKPVSHSQASSIFIFQMMFHIRMASLTASFFRTPFPARSLSSKRISLTLPRRKARSLSRLQSEFMEVFTVHVCVEKRWNVMSCIEEESCETSCWGWWRCCSLSWSHLENMDLTCEGVGKQAGSKWLCCTMLAQLN